MRVFLRRVAHLAIGGIALVPAMSQAGALYIYEMSNTSETGYAGAGMTVRANDAGTVFTNPAGMMRFDKPEMIAGATGVYIDGGFKTNENNTVDGKSGRVNKRVIPGGSFAYVRPINDKWSAGVSVQNYFGLAVDWPGDWVGRYSSVNVALLAPQVQPTVAFRVNDWLSIGAGAALTLGYVSQKMRVRPITPDGQDGKLRYSDSDFAVQGNFGIMLEPGHHTRIGLRYLTETDLDFSDDPQISLRGPLDPVIGGLNFNLDLGTKMPQEVQLGIYHEMNERLNLLGSVGWAEISKFGYVEVEVGDDGLVDTTKDLDFRDVWNFGIGAEYQWKPNLQLTAGVNYDTSMSTGRTRPIAMPLGSLYRYGVGFKYQRREGLTIGGGLTWLYEGNLEVKETNAGTAGKYSNASIYLFSIYAAF